MEHHHQSTTDSPSKGPAAHGKGEGDRKQSVAPSFTAPPKASTRSGRSLQLQSAKTAPSFGHSSAPKQFTPPNKTGLPDRLKSGVEQLSGTDMSDVRVHYHSSKPAQFKALAYAQGNDIHLGAGQEQHLPHEAWHVVQQKQGRVTPTRQWKGVELNDDQGLEKEADVMGDKALALGATMSPTQLTKQSPTGMPMQMARTMAQINQEQNEIANADGGPRGHATVGLEWNLVQMDEDGYPLTGMSHIEIAQSAQTWLGLRYILETESSDRIELVAPPYYVPVAGDGSTDPEYHALTDLIEAQRNALAQVATGANNLSDLMGNWAGFGLTMDPIPGLAATITPRNWSARAGTNQDDLPGTLPTGDVEAGDGDQNWMDAARITGVLLQVDSDYQINVSSDAASYEAAYDHKKSRLVGDTFSWLMDQQEVYPFEAQVTRFRNILNQNIGDVAAAAAARLRLYNSQVSRVLLQHYIVPYLQALRDLQTEQAANGGQSAREFRINSEHTSFIKDMSNAWLKTDLFTYAKSVLQQADYALASAMFDRASDAIDQAIQGDDMPAKFRRHGIDPMRAFYKKLNLWFMQHQHGPGEADDDVVVSEETEARIAVLAEEYEALRQHLEATDGNDGSAGLFGHNAEVAGVRQDTYIPENIMHDLTNQLQIGEGQLMVMEVRNPEAYREYLRYKQVRGWLKTSGWFSAAGWKKRNI